MGRPGWLTNSLLKQPSGFRTRKNCYNHTCASKIRDYLVHKITLAELVDWAENSLIDGEFIHEDSKQLFDIVARLGLSDSNQFALSWDELESIVDSLGYELRIHPEMVKKIAV